MTSPANSNSSFIATDAEKGVNQYSHLNSYLKNIKMVMVNTTLPANIGSAARAMLTMGLTDLVVVNPKHPIDEDCVAYAAKAK